MSLKFSAWIRTSNGNKMSYGVFGMLAPHEGENT
jgi:hypothetical protein